MPRKSSSGWAALFGRVAVKQVIFDLLTGDLFFHKRFRDAFTSAGFEVRWVEKFWFHNIFEVRLRRKSAVLDKSDLRAATGPPAAKTGGTLCTGRLNPNHPAQSDGAGGAHLSVRRSGRFTLGIGIDPLVRR